METVRLTFSWHFSTRMRAGNNGQWFYAESLSRWFKQTPSLVPFTDRPRMWVCGQRHTYTPSVSGSLCVTAQRAEAETAGRAACGASSMRPASPLSRAFKAPPLKPEYCLSIRTLKLAARKDFDLVSVSAAFLLNAENAGIGWTLETSCRLTLGHPLGVRIIQHIKGMMNTT